MRSHVSRIAAAMCSSASSNREIRPRLLAIAIPRAHGVVGINLVGLSRSGIHIARLRAKVPGRLAAQLDRPRLGALAGLGALLGVLRSWRRGPPSQPHAVLRADADEGMVMRVPQAAGE